MKLIELFEATEETFLPMFGGIFNITQNSDKANVRILENHVRDMVRNVNHDFVSNNRSVWFLRFYKNAIIDKILRDNDNSPEELQYLNREKNKLKKFVKEELNLQEVERLFTNMKHYLDMPIQKIKDFKYNDQQPSEVMKHFRELEEDYEEQHLEDGDRYITDDEIDPKDKIVLKINDTLAWWRLPRNYCRVEQSAMGHCGRGDYGSELLSLRSKHDNGYLSHLTFEIDSDGALHQMKGRYNNKPSRKYHKAIVKLLIDPMVTEIIGGGYEDENNFKLSDLSPEYFNIIKEKKPELLPLSDQIDIFGYTEGVMNRIAKKLNVTEPFDSLTQNWSHSEEYLHTPKIPIKTILREINDDRLTEMFNSIDDFIDVWTPSYDDILSFFRMDDEDLKEFLKKNIPNLDEIIADFGGFEEMIVIAYSRAMENKIIDNIYQSFLDIMKNNVAVWPEDGHLELATMSFTPSGDIDEWYGTISAYEVAEGFEYNDGEGMYLGLTVNPPTEIQYIYDNTYVDEDDLLEYLKNY